MIARATLLLALVAGFPLAGLANPQGDGSPEADAVDDVEDAADAEAEAAASKAAEEQAAADEELQRQLDDSLTPSVHVNDGRAEVHYSLSDPLELDDFKTKGFDLVDMHREAALTLGAGSRQAGFLQHDLEFKGDFSCELEVRVTHNTPSALLAIVLNKKVSVLWGQQIVKSKGFRPYDRNSSAPDVTAFREERVCTFKIIKTGTRLAVHCNGRLVAQREFKKKELEEVSFGIAASNIRFVVTALTIEGELE